MSACSGSRDTNIMKFILGRKLNMTQLFDEQGRVTPVTAVVATPNVITKIKSVDSDGYSSVQVGFEDQKESRLGKAVLGIFGGKGYKEVQEFRVPSEIIGTAGAEGTPLAAGHVIPPTWFEKGDEVTVTGPQWLVPKCIDEFLVITRRTPLPSPF